jgi:hypothetical protein
MAASVQAHPEIPALPWADFVNRFRWRQGEHVAAVAPTGAGKTTLLLELIPLRRHSIFFGTKPDDPLYHKLVNKHGFRRVESIDEMRSYDERILLWPKPVKNDIRATMRKQQHAFAAAINMIISQGGWTAWLDESKYMAENLGLKQLLTYLLEQSRSIKVTVICGGQRPAWLPASTLPNSTHLFLWKSNKREDAQRLADVGGIDAKMITEQLKTLDEHEFIYIKSRGTSSQVVRSQVHA